jgi:transcriptional regulator with XRE-family HTH domain
MKSARATAKAATKPRETDAYLRALGERVRMLRNQRGMTRKALARHAKVSERYLAQLEAGLGNGSIVLLRRISRAIGLPVTQLVHEGSEPALDFVLLNQFLDRLSPPALAEARDLLLRHFSAPSDDARRHRIALIGLRGGGKSTIGRLAAERLGLPFIELDERHAERFGELGAERRLAGAAQAEERDRLFARRVFAHQAFHRHAHGARDFAQQEHRDVSLAGLELGEVALGDAARRGQRLARHALLAAPGAHAIAEEGEVGGFGHAV